MLRVRIKYAKSMRDSSGGKYPILQGEITFVCWRVRVEYAEITLVC